jgi:hypothetical protein
VKDQIRNDITAVNEAMTSGDAGKIKEASERLRTSSMEIGKAIYSQANNEQNTQQEQ